MNIKTIIAALAISLAPAFAFAQSLEAHKAQSDNLDKKIDIVEAEIKTLKAKKKAEPSNLQHEADLAAKQAELKKLKQEKKVYDKAVKAEKKAKEETKEAEKANKKLIKAQEMANSLKTGANAGKSDEVLAAELEGKIAIVEGEIKTLKAKKKAEPSVIAHASNLASKQAELKELKRQKKIIDGAIKAQKKANEEAKEAQKATSKHENAQQNVKQMQEQKAKEKEKENN